jgi:hypothetical protein
MPVAGPLKSMNLGRQNKYFHQLLDGFHLLVVRYRVQKGTVPLSWSEEYTPEFKGAFTGGTIQYVEVSVEKEQYRNPEMEITAALALD